MFNGLKAKLTPSTNGRKPMKNKSYEALTATLERKEQLKNELKETQEKRRELSHFIDRTNRELFNTRNAIKGYDNKSYQDRLKVAREQESKLEAELSKAKSEMAALDKMIEGISTTLSECAHIASIAHVLEHQQAREAEQEELDKYQALIEEQQQKISAANIREDKVTPLIRRREELLADIALGKADAENLGKLDDDLAKARQAQETEQFTKDQIITDANNTTAGLERRTGMIKLRIAELDRLTPGILDALVMGMARQSAEDFNRIAQDMGQKLMELAALNALVSEFGARRNTGFLPDWWHIKIPNVNGVEPCSMLSGNERHYIDAHYQNIDIKEAVNQLKQGLIDQGVNI
jgi:hypothetical protein